ncbi:MAG: hypothetical protein Lokiarch_24880, partial [Candidatus Lokiarchaeum sp. GC14_75]
DQKIMTERGQEGIKKTMENLKFLKPAIREKIIKRMQRMAAKRKGT